MDFLQLFSPENSQKKSKEEILPKPSKGQNFIRKGMSTKEMANVISDQLIQHVDRALASKLHV